MTTNSPNEIGSLDDLSELLATIETQGAQIVEGGVPLDNNYPLTDLEPATDYASAAEEPDFISINSGNTPAPAVVVNPVAEPEAEVVHAPIPSAPSLKATLEEDAQKSKEDGNYEEVRDVILSVLRQMHADALASKPKGASEQVSRILENAVIDLNNFEVAPSNNDPMALHTQLKIIAAANPQNSFPVIALKSGYKAEMSALTSADKIDVRNLRGSILDQTSKMLRIIYTKVMDTTVGKISFDEFLNITAEEDYETLLYGVFTATFPSKTEYNLNCPHCKQVNNLELYPSSLVEVIDKERLGQYVQEVLNGYNRGREFLANSLVAKSTRKLLNESKIIVETITPTLRHMLNNMMSVERLKNQNSELLTITKYIGKLFIPDVNAFSRGQILYIEVTSKEDILNILTTLPAKDMASVRAAISERVRQYSIEYRIPDFTCASSTCSKPIQNVSIDVMNLIFLGIAGEM